MFNKKYISMAVMSFAALSARAELLDNQKAQSSKSFQAYATSEAMLKEAAKVADKFDSFFKLNTNCKNEYSVKPLAYSILKAVDYDDKKGATTGAWKMAFSASKCGTSKTYSAIYVSQPSGSPMVLPYYPGNTLADYKLVKDATNSVMMGAALKTKQPNCREMSIFDMVITKEPVFDTNKKQAGAWEETWTVQACAMRVGIPLKFVPDPDGKGTSFTLSIKPVKN